MQLCRRLENRFEPVSVRVDDEGGIVGRAVVQPQAGRAIVDPTGGDGRLMEGIDGGPVRRRKRNVEAGTGCADAVALVFERELVAAAGRPVADGLVRFAGPDVRSDTNIAEGRQGCVIEGRRAGYVSDAKGKVVQHV